VQLATEQVHVELNTLQNSSNVRHQAPQED
jgi:hypothetical protein